MIKKYINDYLSLNLADYDNIGIDFEISKFLLAVLVGLCISFFVIDWHRGYMLLAVKKLFRHGALDEASAKTLGELGLDRSFSVKWALSHETRLAKIVKRVGEIEYTYEEYIELEKQKKRKNKAKLANDGAEGAALTQSDKPDFKTARFYLNSNRIDQAREIEQNYSSSVIKTSVFCLMFVIIFVGITLIMPELLSFINSSIVK